MILLDKMLNKKRIEMFPIVRFRPVKFKQVWRCFFPDKYAYYSYLGYAHNIYPEKPNWEREHAIIEDFLKYLDSVAKPRLVPRFFLRLIELFGNDNSVWRVRNRFLHNLSKRLMKGVRLTDMKTKWNDWDVRIYGYFPEEVEKEIEKVEIKIRNLRDLTM